MTGGEQIEATLRAAMETMPSDETIRRLDARVARVMGDARTRPRGTGAPTRFWRPLALAAMLALTAGAVGAAVTLLDRLAAESSPGWALAWERGERLGLRATDAGVAVTLERAYTDLNQVAIGISVDGLEALPVPSSGRNDYLLSIVSELRGPDGWAPAPGASANAARVVEGGQSALILTYGTPPSVAGTWSLMVSSIGYGPDAMIEGSWAFEFELPAPDGIVLTADAADTVGGATLTLTELRISATAVVARIGLEVEGVTFAGWSPGTAQDGEVIRHAGESIPIVEETLLADPTVNEYRTEAGTDSASGTWEIVIPELGYTTADDQGVPLVGPWILTVTVP